MLVSQLTNNSCVDRVNPRIGVFCPKVAYLCDNSVYYMLMTEQCPRTCNGCPGSGSATLPPSSRGKLLSTCVDRVNPRAGISDCPQRACLSSNSVYFELMTEQCPKTCNKCPGTVHATPADSN
ncbi:unnamed protein product [Angiostrongylus costaricensis]|uniref:ShKT domain-containing protein n=1 Tax=Angiostrongylus costaricensis TaxID=334426 RepID=A0A3P7I5U5_ANGCS|nr:unnamed protein product [Angiostrongylus costaricensis]